MKIINESTGSYTFTQLFKEVEITNKINNAAGITEVVYVAFENEGFDDEARFTNYKDFKSYVMEEYNSSKEILSSTFSINQPFEVTWGYFQDKLTYKVSLVAKR